MGMSAGRMSTYNPIQQLYQMSLASDISRVMPSTYSKMNELGQSAESAYKPPDFDKYVKQAYVDPIQYQMNEGIKDLQHSSERFSMGRQAREAALMSESNNKINNLIGNAMMSYRNKTVSGLNNAYGNQLNYLMLMNNALGSPLDRPSQENVTSQQDLLASLFS